MVKKRDSLGSSALAALHRGGVERAHSYAFKAVITVIVSGIVVAVWLGIKATLGMTYRRAGHQR